MAIESICSLDGKLAELMTVKNLWNEKATPVTIPEESR
jgi:hypothetical protein